MKPNIYNDDDILKHSKCGIEFEFYSSLDIIDLAKVLEGELNKKIIVPMKINALGSSETPMIKSKVVPTDNLFKLEIDNSGGADMRELITGPLPYKESRVIIKKMLNWIKENGYTSDKCSIHLNISFDEENITPLNNIENMDILKYILNFDEDYVYELFPERKKSVYARSIKYAIANDFFFYLKAPFDYEIKNQINVPNEKYFGINFSKTKQNYLEFRYLGGNGYENKLDDIYKAHDYFVLSLFKNINSEGYSLKEQEKINEIYERQRILVSRFSDYVIFKEHYPNFKISIDLKTDTQIIKSFWNKIKHKLYNLIVRSDVHEVKFNYDSSIGKFQLAEGIIENALLVNYDIISCEIEGLLRNCDIYHSNISESRIKDCVAVYNNKFNHCKIEDSLLNESNTCEDCYIDVKQYTVECEVIGGVIRSGILEDKSLISDKTIIVKSGPQEKKQKLKNYKWIKKLATQYNSKNNSNK